MDEQTTNATEHWEPDELMMPPPKWPMVIGIISIILSSFGLICGGIGFLLAPFGASMVESSFQQDSSTTGHPVPYGMEVTAVDYGIGGLSLILSVVLLFAGITAVTRRPVTRPLHLVYAGLGLPLSLWSILNQMGKAELNAQWAQEYPSNPMAAGMDGDSSAAMITQMITLALMLLLGVGIPLFYLIWFGLVKTKPEQVTGSEEGVY